jgi:aspartate/glutamate/glutamine transport system permease protein
MALETTTTRPISVNRRSNLLSFKNITNAIGWLVLAVLIWWIVIPAVFNGRWQIFQEWAIWEFLAEGLWVTMRVAFFAVILSSVFGIILALGRLSDNKFYAIPATTYIEIIRATPSFLIIFYAFIALPKIGIRLDSFWAATIGLTIYTSAILAEIVRAGILSVEKGQLEAAYSLGLSPLNTMISIVLPQALRRMVPSIVSQLITLVKDTSLAYAIALQELTSQGRAVYQKYGNVLETMFVIAMTYFIICYILSVISQRLELKKAR